MNLLEKKSKRKIKALKTMVENGEYSCAYALERLENYHDTGKVISSDYDFLAEWLDSLINEPVENEQVEEITEE